ncbi:winged helix DNA-binding protein [Sneathiella sp. P13V-1]|uniref:winged helix-turn-helix transcriptional regulator n=1 Tax=Sneathiella sp. P13V-1 TaxID=2697366 RepID=UPI00187B8786|nr:helix-turn-helix domain-containing protein [Sneathiella sp. P13V-1]MBE7635996.1 winged helix DNA-binding protein [Sneathiella sp. P13V-1]
MQKKTFSDINCAIAQTLEQIGDGWTLLILRNAFHRMRHFDQFQENLGIPTNTLSNRLKKLTESGILERRPCAHDKRAFEYRLTDKGLDLYPVIVTLFQWGERWYSQPDGPRLELIEKATDIPIPEVKVRGADGNALHAREVKVVVGPGGGEHATDLVKHHG